MKSLKYILGIALCSLAFTSCLDGNDGIFNEDWKEADTSVTPYGNNNLQETNVLTIAQLKEKYKTAVTTNYRNPETGLSYVEVDEEVQIKAYVTANDISGNLYNELAIQDETGALMIRLQEGGIFGTLAVGTEILIDMKGLCIGNYRMQPSIGMPSIVASGNYAGYKQLGKVALAIWNQHFKVTGNKKIIEPILFADGSSKVTWTAFDDGGKLGTIKNVSIRSGSYYDNNTSQNVDIVYNEDSKFADAKYETSVNWYFNEQPIGSKKNEIKVMLYNSNYADFAAEPLTTKIPYKGKVNITGIIKYYTTNPSYPSWEIVIRSLDDITPAQ